MTVEAALANEAPQTDAAVITPDAPVGESAPVVEALSEDAQMDEVWNKLHPEDRVERGNDGKFVSRNADGTETPLEGGEGEEQPVDPATVTTDVPLPANWNGLDEVWGKLPAELRGPIAEHQKEQHAKLSDYGRKVAMFEPLQQAAAEFSEYFNGSLKDKDGQPIHPADGVRYLANIQRMMDSDPVNTLLSITDSYGARDKLAAALGIKAEPGQQPDPSARENALLAKIDRLEARIVEFADPSRIERVVEERTAKSKHEEEVSRLTSSKPLYAEIPEEDMVFWINKAWKALGQDAAKDAVFDHAYNAAIEASPTLRAKSQAATKAAEDKAAKAEAAKRGASVNVKSTAGNAKPKPQSDDEAMEEAWRRLHAEG